MAGSTRPSLLSSLRLKTLFAERRTPLIGLMLRCFCWLAAVLEKCAARHIRAMLGLCRITATLEMLSALRLLPLLVVLCSLPLAAQTWEGALERGGSVSVDRDSRRPVYESGGVSRPLWDGVHHLDDGSTVIVRDGVAVPTPGMLRAWSGAAAPEATYLDRPCDQLMRLICGFDNACSTAAACLTARSLLADEGREQAALPPGAGAHPPTATSERCRSALHDPAFPACASLTAPRGDSRCEGLVARVCGADDQCAKAPACDAARQLLRLETEERLANEDPAAISTSGHQCLDAASMPFFAACQGGETEP